MHGQNRCNDSPSRRTFRHTPHIDSISAPPSCRGGQHQPERAPVFEKLLVGLVHLPSGRHHRNSRAPCRTPTWNPRSIRHLRHASNHPSSTNASNMLDNVEAGRNVAGEDEGSDGGGVADGGDDEVAVASDQGKADWATGSATGSP